MESESFVFLSVRCHFTKRTGGERGEHLPSMYFGTIEEPENRNVTLQCHLLLGTVTNEANEGLGWCVSTVIDLA